MKSTKKRKTHPKAKYKNCFSKVYPRVSLDGFNFPPMAEAESVGAVLKAMRLFLIEKYGDQYPKAFTQAAVAEYMG